MKPCKVSHESRKMNLKSFGNRIYLAAAMLSGGLFCLIGCTSEPVEVGEENEDDTFWDIRDSGGVRVDFASCGSTYLMANEALDVRFEHGDQQRVCPVPTAGALSSRELVEGETIPDEGDWLPVRYELCRGWVEASKLRCPETGEKPSWLYLSVPYHNQMSETDSDRWVPSTACMATSLTMVLDYYHLEDDVNAVNALAAAIDPAEGGYDPGCSANPVCVSAGAAVQVAASYCSTVTAGDGWRLEDLIAALNDANPVFVLVTGGLTPGAFGHAVVIIGYLDEGDRFIYHDPMDEGDDRLDKGNSIAGWDELAASWVGPIDVGDPLQPEGHSFFGLTCSE